MFNMRKKEAFIVFNDFIRYKIISCVVAFFVLVSSINLLNFDMDKVSFTRTVNVFVRAVSVQFFYVSTISAKTVLKLLGDYGMDKSDGIKEIDCRLRHSAKDCGVDKADGIKEARKQESKRERKDGSREGNGFKASKGYLILSCISVFDKVEDGKWIKGIKGASKGGAKILENIWMILYIYCGRDRGNILFIEKIILAIILSREGAESRNIIKGIEQTGSAYADKPGCFCV